MRRHGEDVDTAGHGKCDTNIGGIANTQRRSLQAYFALPINHNLESVMIEHALFVRLEARRRMEAEDS